MNQNGNGHSVPNIYAENANHTKTNQVRLVLLIALLLVAGIFAEDCMARQRGSITSSTTIEKQYSLAPEHWSLVGSDGKELPYPETYFTKTKYGYAFSNKDIEPYVDIVLNHEFDGMFSSWFHTIPAKTSGEPFEPSEMTGVEFGAMEVGSSRMVYQTDGTRKMESETILRFSAEQNNFDFAIGNVRKWPASYPRHYKTAGPYKIFMRVPKGVRLENRATTKLKFLEVTRSTPEAPFAKLTSQTIRSDEKVVDLPTVIGRVLVAHNERHTIVLGREHRELVIVDNKARQLKKQIELPGSNTQFAANNEFLYVWNRVNQSILKIELESGKVVLDKKLPPNFYIRNMKVGSKYLLATGHQFREQLNFHLFDVSDLEKLDLETEFELSSRETHQDKVESLVRRFANMTGTITTGLQHFVSDAKPFYGLSVVEPTEERPVRILKDLGFFAKSANGRKLDGSLLAWWPKFAGSSFGRGDRHRNSIESETDFDAKLSGDTRKSNGLVAETNIRIAKDHKDKYAPLPISQRFFHQAGLGQLLFVPDSMSQLVYRDYDWKNEIELADANERIKIAEARFPNTTVPEQTLKIPLLAISSFGVVDWEIRPIKSKTGYLISSDAKIEDGVFTWTVPQLPPQEIKFELRATHSEKRSSSKGTKTFYRVTSSDKLRVSINVVDSKNTPAGGLRVLYDLDQAAPRLESANHKGTRVVEPKEKKLVQSTKRSNPNEASKSTEDGVTAKQIPLEGQVKSACAGREGRTLFISLKDNSELQVLDLKTGQLKSPIPMPGKDLLHAAGKSNLVLYSPSSQGALIRDLETEKIIKTKIEFPTEIKQIAFGHSDDRFLYAIGKEKAKPSTLYVFDFEEKVADQALLELGELDGTNSTILDVSANGQHVVFGQRQGVSFNGTSFEKWQIGIGNSRFFKKLRMSHSGRFVFTDDGVFEAGFLVDESRKIGMSDLSSDLYTVASRGELLIRKPGHPALVGAIPMRVGSHTPFPTSFEIPDRFFSNLKLGVAALLSSGKIYHYQLDPATTLDRSSVTLCGFLKPPAIQPSKRWSFPLLLGSNSSEKPTTRHVKVEILRGPDGMEYSDGKLTWDVPNQVDAIVPVYIRTTSVHQSSFGFFLTKESFDRERNAIMDFNISGREKYVRTKKKKRGVKDDMSTKATVSKMLIGNGGDVILFCEGRSRSEQASIVDLTTITKTLKAQAAKSETLAIGLDYLVMCDTESQVLRSMPVEHSDSSMREISADCDYITMGRNSNVLFGFKKGVLNAIDPATLKTIASAEMDNREVTGLVSSGDGKRVFIASPDGKLKQLSTVQLPGVKVFESPEGVRTNNDGSIVAIKNQLFNSGGALLESFKADAIAMTTDLPECVGKLEIIGGNWQLKLINLETGKTICETLVKGGVEGKEIDPSEWLDVQVSKKRIVYLDKRRREFKIRKLEFSSSSLGTVPTFLSKPVSRVEPGTPFVYRPSVVSTNYPLHWELEQAPQGAVFKDLGTIVWDKPTNASQMFRIRVRDFRGRESVQEFSVGSK